MANEVYTADEIKLQDGTEVTLVPLSLSRLRKFHKRWNAFMDYLEAQRQMDADSRDSQDEVTENQFEAFLDLMELSLGKALKGDRSDEDFREYLDDTLDEPTIYRVLDKCGGLKLNDPNLQAAAMQAAMQQMQEMERVGTN